MTRRVLSVIGRCGLVIALVLPGTLGAAPGAQDPSRSDAVAVQKKLEMIASRGALPPKGNALVRTSFTERELNAFFKITGPTFLPPGLTSPELGFDPGGKVRAKSIVDLTAVRSAKIRGWSDPLAYLGGSLEIALVGVLKAANGSGTLVIESATLAGVPVPTTLVQELVTYYSRSPEMPQGLDLSQPFALPANIRAIETQRGAATIVQAGAASS